MSFLARSSRILAVLMVGLTFAAATLDTADARRGGSFGSRGTKTFSAPPPTTTAPGAAAPIQRTMTPQSQATQPGMAAGAAAQQARRPGLFGGGFFGSMLGGLALGGLIGMMMGNGFGGLAGMFGFIVQALLIGLAIMFVMRLLRRGQSAPATAGGPRNDGRAAFDGPAGGNGAPGGNAGLGGLFGGGAGAGGTGGAGNGGFGAGGFGGGPAATPIKLGGDDFDRFEQMLAEVQAAYGREDFEALRRLSTPEILSYLSQELAENSTRGLRNEVSDVKLLQGDLAEAWREGDQEFATVAMRYQSIDVMRSRADGQIVEGDPARPTETTEVWTFVRRRGGDWQLSAIQEV